MIEVMRRKRMRLDRKCDLPGIRIMGRKNRIGWQGEGA